MYYPASGKVEEYAKTFRSLADIYEGMQNRKEHFDRQDMEGLFDRITKEICGGCTQYEECWDKYALRTYQRLYEAMEQMEEKGWEAAKEKLKGSCVCPEKMAEQMDWDYRNMRLRFYYANCLMENREAVAEQFREMAALFQGIMDDFGQMTEPDVVIRKKICRLFEKRDVLVKKIYVLHRRRYKDMVYIRMAARKGVPVELRELADILSFVLKKDMIAVKTDTRTIGREWETVLFVEQTNYKVMYGVSQMARDGENICGDSFSHMQREEGEAIMSLSDGMGSGESANRESKRLIELLEQFMESGISKETALKLINSTAVYERGGYSTLDVCGINLYSGICEIRKLGAAATFILRGEEVEVIRKFKIPVGLFHHLEIQAEERLLKDGDYIVMVTDGVLEAIQAPNRELAFCELLKKQQIKEPKGLAKAILEEVVGQAKGTADDMTVLTAGIWKRTRAHF